MALYRRGQVWHYDFTLGAHRYRGSTKESAKVRAELVEARLKTRIEQHQTPAAFRRAPLLGDFAERFLNWVESSPLSPNTKRYYQNGWLRLEPTRLRNMRMDAITTEDVDAIQFAGSPAWINQALRTLRRILGKATEWKLLAVAPKIGLRKEYGREQTIDPETEAKLLAHAGQPLKDVLIIIQDCGARPEEVFRIRIENINWSARTVFNPHGKTRKARRHLPISDRMLNVLLVRCAGRKDGWLLPSGRSLCGHLTTVAKQFRAARRAAGLPESLVLYCARHTFGTTAYAATRNLPAIMDAMGHSDVRTAMRYQHQSMDSIRDAINQRNAVPLRHNSSHNEEIVQ